MNSFCLILRNTGRFIAGALCIQGAIAYVDTDFNSLLKNSPFGPSMLVEKPLEQSHPLEFKGILVENGTTYFSIHDPETTRSAWAQLHEKTKLDFEVLAYNPSHRQITVNHRGTEIKLVLPAIGQQQDRATTRNQNALMANTNTVAKPPLPTNEATRLSNIAAEIKRRRALRQQQIEQTRR